MKKLTQNASGFTLIELIMVIVVLGFLAVVALPEYADLTTKAKRANEEGVVGGVRAGIATQLAKNFTTTTGAPVFPSALDGVATGTVCNTAVTCFGNVIPGGVKDGNWTKSGASSYTGPNGGIYAYASATGTFN